MNLTSVTLVDKGMPFVHGFQYMINLISSFILFENSKSLEKWNEGIWIKVVNVFNWFL